MDSQRWQHLQQLFGQALACPAGDREAFVAGACAGDAVLADELRALLRSDETLRDPVPRALSSAADDWLSDDRRSWIDRRLGPWRIVAHIADGGMGAVYRAERADGQYEQQVAVKMLNPALMSDDARARLEVERRILARLAHPSIARLLDGGRTDDGAPYLVMEYVDGQPIDAWCESRALDTRARLRLFVQVCEAVDFAHRNLVVHRDLKPANILIDADGRPKLLDFGIARLLDAEGVTRTGERVLTPSYASPEQVLGGPITTATDVYALGVLLYVLLAGRLPYDEASGSTLRMAQAIVEGEPTRPSRAVLLGDNRRLRAAGDGVVPQASRLSRELAGDLDNIVLTALRKEPERRYATPEDLADDLRRVLEHRPVSARADRLLYRLSKWWQRHPLGVTAGLVAVLVGVGGSTWFTLRLADERDRARAAEQSTRRAAAFTASLLEGTGANARSSRQVSVRDLLDNAVQRVDEELNDDPEVALQLREALSTALHSWGAVAESLKVTEAALADARRLGPSGRVAVARLSVLMSTVLHDLDRRDEALDWARRGEQAWRDIGDPAEHAHAVLGVAMSLAGIGRREEALPVFREALAAYRRLFPDGHEDTAWTLNNLAWSLHALGRLQEARPVYEEARALQLRLNVVPQDLAQTENNLAGLLDDLGDIDGAEAMWRLALQRFEAVFGPSGHAAVGRGVGQLAGVAIDRGRADEADRFAQRALDTLTRQSGDMHVWAARAQRVLARVRLLQGRVDEADRLLNQSDEAMAGRTRRVTDSEVPSASLRAMLELARGRPALAAAQAERAVQALEGLGTGSRVRTDTIEWTWAEALLQLGQRDAAREHVRRALASSQARPATHWVRQAYEVMAALPPWADNAAPAAIERARALVNDLRTRLGPQAPMVRELEKALVRAGAGG